jgi:hypothetical protein
MPPANRAATLVVVKGSGQYARYLDRLAKAIKAEGTELPPGYLALVEWALAVAGAQRGILAPPRTGGHGGARKGAGGRLKPRARGTGEPAAR